MVQGVLHGKSVHLKTTFKKIYLTARKKVLVFLSPILGRTHADRPQDPFRKILFIRIDGVGDLVLSTPALKAVRSAFPDAELTVLANPVNESLLFHNPHVDRVVVYDRLGSCKAKRSVIGFLRTNRFDVVIDPFLGYGLETAVIARLTGAPVRVGYASFGREVFFSKVIPEPDIPKHFIDLTFDVLKPLGIPRPEGMVRPEIFLTDEEKHQAQNWLRDNGLGSRPVVGIHPGAFYPSQRWPADYFAELYLKVRRDDRFDLLLLGGTGDRGIVDSVASRIEGRVCVLVEGDLRRFAAILSCCSLLVCNNSGPLHMATALGVPTLSFMGPTVREIWSPVGGIHRVFRMDDLPCIGCNLGYCRIGTHDCMRLLTPAAAEAALNDLILTKEPFASDGKRVQP